LEYLDAGYTHLEIMKIVGCSPSTIQKVKKVREQIESVNVQTMNTINFSELTYNILGNVKEQTAASYSSSSFII